MATETTLYTIKLDPREIRALHSAVTLVGEVFARAADDHDIDVPMPDGRKVPAGDSAAMKLEALMLAEGIEL